MSRISPRVRALTSLHSLRYQYLIAMALIIAAVALLVAGMRPVSADHRGPECDGSETSGSPECWVIGTGSPVTLTIPSDAIGVEFEAWGGGGGGGGRSNPGAPAGGGGGGGDYAAVAGISVTGGEDIQVTIGAGGAGGDGASAGEPGGETSVAVDSSTVVSASGGGGGDPGIVGSQAGPGDGGDGGDGSGSTIGDTTHTGGDGGDGGTILDWGGGGGGSPTPAGSVTDGASGDSGGGPGSGFATGGTGGSSTVGPAPGGHPGAGGGGRGEFVGNVGVVLTGAAGGDGGVRVTWTFEAEAPLPTVTKEPYDDDGDWVDGYRASTEQVGWRVTVMNDHPDPVEVVLRDAFPINGIIVPGLPFCGLNASPDVLDALLSVDGLTCEIEGNSEIWFVVADSVEPGCEDSDPFTNEIEAWLYVDGDDNIALTPDYQGEYRL